MEAVNNITIHITDERLASFIDRTLSSKDRENITKHLLVCAECRAVMMESHKAKQEVKVAKQSKRGLILQVIAPLALAASIAWVVVVPIAEQREDSSYIKELNHDKSWFENAKEWIERQIEQILGKD